LLSLVFVFQRLCQLGVPVFAFQTACYNRCVQVYLYQSLCDCFPVCPLQSAVRLSVLFFVCPPLYSGLCVSMFTFQSLRFSLCCSVCVFQSLYSSAFFFVSVSINVFVFQSLCSNMCHSVVECSLLYVPVFITLCYCVPVFKFHSFFAHLCIPVFMLKYFCLPAFVFHSMLQILCLNSVFSRIFDTVFVFQHDLSSLFFLYPCHPVVLSQLLGCCLFIHSFYLSLCILSFLWSLFCLLCFLVCAIQSSLMHSVFYSLIFFSSPEIADEIFVLKFCSTFYCSAGVLQSLYYNPFMCVCVCVC